MACFAMPSNEGLPVSLTDPSLTTPSHPLADSTRRLELLTERIRYELELLSYRSKDWIPAVDGVLDVLIIGGGHAGQTAAFALARKDVRRVLVLDEAAHGSEGPWSTTAKMHTLRTPKTLKGPDLDLPSLSPHEWFVARFGQQRWDAITHIPREDWQQYLAFYRSATGISVRNETTVLRVDPPTEADGPFFVRTLTAGEEDVLLARRVVFATGLEGAGGIAVPQNLFGHLPSSVWSHTSDAVDFATLKGKRVGVVGGGASAFDAAATALDNGAASVDSFMRRAAMPSANPLRWMEWVAFLEHYADWDDSMKWAFTRRVLDVDQPTTQGSLWRCYAHDNFTLSFGSPWLSTRMEGDEVVVDVAGVEHRFDYLIAGTGVTVDLGLRPELASVVDDIALWGDRYEPEPGADNAALARYPYLGPDFSFIAKDAATAPWMSRLYHFAQGARITMGISGHQLSGLPTGVQRLVWGITREQFRENATATWADFVAYDTPELVNIGRRPEHLPQPQVSSSSDRLTGWEAVTRD
jgi:cation diffusion facilitator CzcD-associated flavoprotein CzcO